jgi:heme exporter protein D
MAVLGDHGGFIVAAYIVVAAALGGLLAWIVLDGRALKHQLAELEARGVRRRSARSSTT